MKKIVSKVLNSFANDNRVIKENLTSLNNRYNPTKERLEKSYFRNRKA